MFGIQSKKKLEERAYDLVYTAKKDVDLANKTTYFSTFMEYYDEILACFQEAVEIEKKVKKFKSIHGNLNSDYLNLKFEMPWHMRDAMEREYNDIIKDSNGKYRNNQRMLRARCRNFKESIDEYRSRFDKETTLFADGLLKKLSLKLNPFDDELPFKSEGEPSNNSVFGSEYFYDFDALEGHDFEYWCANLLRQNGFEDVEVTQGSGDQGVDIVAEKDDIRYAIQCKCYSKDLGNTPIQEVSAGKVFYQCQIGVVMTNRYFTQSAKDLAKATGTLLWDRERIIRMMNLK